MITEPVNYLLITGNQQARRIIKLFDLILSMLSFFPVDDVRNTTDKWFRGKDRTSRI